MATRTDIPRWAVELGADRWDQINELLYEGWQPRAVLAELQLPRGKLSSLTVHARKYRYRRVLAPVARLREVLVGGAEELGPKCVKLLGLALQQALSPETSESKRLRTAAILADFLCQVERIGQKAEEAERDRERKEGGAGEKIDASEVVRQVLDVFHITPPGGGSDGGG